MKRRGRKHIYYTKGEIEGVQREKRKNNISEGIMSTLIHMDRETQSKVLTKDT